MDVEHIFTCWIIWTMPLSFSPSSRNSTWCCLGYAENVYSEKFQHHVASNNCRCSNRRECGIDHSISCFLPVSVKVLQWKKAIRRSDIPHMVPITCTRLDMNAPECGLWWFSGSPIFLHKTVKQTHGRIELNTPRQNLSFLSFSFLLVRWSRSRIPNKCRTRGDSTECFLWCDCISPVRRLWVQPNWAAIAAQDCSDVGPQRSPIVSSRCCIDGYRRFEKLTSPI